MKISQDSTSAKTRISMDKSEWETIGRGSGWLKSASEGKDLLAGKILDYPTDKISEAAEFLWKGSKIDETNVKSFVAGLDEESLQKLLDATAKAMGQGKVDDDYVTPQQLRKTDDLNVPDATQEDKTASQESSGLGWTLEKRVEDAEKFR